MVIDSSETVCNECNNAAEAIVGPKHQTYIAGQMTLEAAMSALTIGWSIVMPAP